MSMQSGLGHPAHGQSILGSAPTLGSSRSGGSRSGQSWEMISAPLPPSLSPQQQQQQQQQQQLRDMQQRSVTSPSSGWTPGVDQQGIVGQNVIGQEILNGVGLSGGSAILPHQRLRGSQTAIQRRPSQEIPSQPRSKTEIIRSNTVSSAGRPIDFVDGSVHQQRLDAATSFQPTPAVSQPGIAGVNQFQLDQVKSQDSASGVGNLSRSQHFRVQSPVPQQNQGSALREASNLYENLPLSKNSKAPSMHIINQSGMTGARVIRNNSDGFRSSGGRNVTPTSQFSGLAAGNERENMLTPASQVLDLSDNLSREALAPPTQQLGVARDWRSTRGIPQEHDDLTHFRNNSPLEVNQTNQIQETRDTLISEAGSVLDRKCPVCGMDCSQISMDEFQTHVFECFDNTDDTSIAPETMQPQRTPEQTMMGGSRVCPMCEKQFPESTSQQYFEGHVQSHFEEVAEQFEVLNVQQQ